MKLIVQCVAFSIFLQCHIFYFSMRQNTPTDVYVS